jgi:hypothetical protein
MKKIPLSIALCVVIAAIITGCRSDETNTAVNDSSSNSISDVSNTDNNDASEGGWGVDPDFFDQDLETDVTDTTSNK